MILCDGERATGSRLVADWQQTGSRLAAGKNGLLTTAVPHTHNAPMFQAIRQVIFAFTAVCCGLIGLFWLWFMYQFSLRWLDADGEVGAVMGTAVVFGREGAYWIGGVAVGWLLLALFFGFMQWRISRSPKSEA